MRPDRHSFENAYAFVVQPPYIARGYELDSEECSRRIPDARAGLVSSFPPLALPLRRTY